MLRSLADWLIWLLITLGVLALVPFLAVVYLVDRLRVHHDA